jgi:DNA-binding FrmR family transcriptional regulator
MNRKVIPYGTKLPVAFTNKELEDIRSCIMIGEDFGRHAVVEGKRLVLNLSLDDIEELQGHVAAEANHTRDAKLRKRLDEVFLKINGCLHYLWRAVDQDGDVLDILVQSRRVKKAAKKFFRKLLKRLHYVPSVIITDKLKLPMSIWKFSFLVRLKARLSSRAKGDAKDQTGSDEMTHQASNQGNHAISAHQRGKRAVIFGAGGSIGRAVAKEFATERGATL